MSLINTNSPNIKLSNSAPQLGLGGTALGNLFKPISDKQASILLSQAYQQYGIRVFDTAPYYGHGLSELRLGRYLQGLSKLEREQIWLSTKVGRCYETTNVPESKLETKPDLELESSFTPPHKQAITARFEDELFATSEIETALQDRILATSTQIPRWRFDFSAAGIITSYQRSCRHLGTENFACLFIHDLDRHVLTDSSYEIAWQQLTQQGGWLELLRLQQSHKVKYLGLGVNCIDSAYVALQKLPEINILLLAGRCSLYEWLQASKQQKQALISLLQLAESQQQQILFGGLLNSGLVPTAPQPYYNYQPAPAAELAKLQALAEMAKQNGTDYLSLALQFPEQYLLKKYAPKLLKLNYCPSQILVGMRSVAELAANCQAYQNNT